MVTTTLTFLDAQGEVTGSEVQAPVQSEATGEYSCCDLEGDKPAACSLTTDVISIEYNFDNLMCEWVKRTTESTFDSEGTKTDGQTVETKETLASTNCFRFDSEA